MVHAHWQIVPVAYTTQHGVLMLAFASLLLFLKIGRHSIGYPLWASWQAGADFFDWPSLEKQSLCQVSTELCLKSQKQTAPHS